MSYTPSVLFLSQRECGDARRSLERFAGEKGWQISALTCETHDIIDTTQMKLERPDLILIHSASVFHIDSFLKSYRERHKSSGVLGVFCSDRICHGDITRLLEAGMDDYVTCPFRAVDVAPRISRLLSERQSTEKIVSSILSSDDSDNGLLVCASDALTKQIQLIPRFGESNASLLISGETGTGKELYARLVHANSTRRSQSFVPVDCGAIPESIFESELFGHVKGAFTDAYSDRKGLIGEANGGTLFLDEIDSLSILSQSKLLRFLQNGEYRQVGSSHHCIANVRVIAATNSNLLEEVESKRFRKDLYYRLNILSAHLPPLRDRKSDIPLLTHRFLQKHGKSISRLAMMKLMSHDWPGNVRELEAVISRTAVVCGDVIRPQDIELNGEKDRRAILPFQDAKERMIERFETEYLKQILFQCRGNISQAARAAGKDRRAFQRLVKRHGYDRRFFTEDPFRTRHDSSPA
jgi:DNA-binding NtrC family response regulator